MKHILALVLVVGTVLALTATAEQSPPSTGKVFVAYYWRAKPGQMDAYNEYIRKTAEPIDEDARRVGVFEEVRTVMPASGTTTDWTHLRIFRLKDAAAAQADLVRREVWTELTNP
jgi:hypothetical protein